MKTWLSWSSGKDSAWAFYQLMLHAENNLCGLFTSINENKQRVAMHGVRTQLLELQAERLAMPLHVIELPHPCSNANYQQRMQSFIDDAVDNHVTHMAFGDLFLDDVRTYREKQMADTSITAVFPIWLSDTTQMAHGLIEKGFKAKLCCVDTKQIPAEFLGAEFDHYLLKNLPTGADACGENGEFHTFVYDAPMFSAPIDIETGVIHEAGQFHFVDLVQKCGDSIPAPLEYLQLS